MLPPEIRASMVKDFFALLRGGKISQGPEILAAADPTFLRLVEESSRLDWLAAEPVVKLADHARALLGAEAWRAVHRAAADEVAQRPLFRTFMQGMVRLFGASPAGFCKIFPTLLNQAHRNYGAIEHAPIDETTALVRLLRCPRAALSRGMLDVFAGTAEGLLAPSARGVRVEVEYKPGADNAALTIRWER
jgi:hypothetical protein